jgi:proprotein convertase subtilisin/kexin type 5
MNSNRSCVRCAHENCKVCSPQTSCWTCNEGFFRTRTACISGCPTGQYIGYDFLKYAQCVNCPSNCLECDSKDTCKTCAPPNIKVTSPYPDVPEATVQKALKATCVSTPLGCPNGTFDNETGNVCQICSRGCASCDRQGNCLANCSSNCSDCIARPARCIKC